VPDPRDASGRAAAGSSCPAQRVHDLQPACLIGRQQSGPEATLGAISFDLLSDFHPHGDVAQRYGVYRPHDGISERAVFVVDKEGRIAWSKVYDIPEQPSNEDFMEALSGLGRS
jgi:hypothetical protein